MKSGLAASPLALLLLPLLVCAATVTAQTYPARAVRIVIPHAPAGGTDILARAIAQKLSDTVNLLHSGITKALAGEELRRRLADRGFDQGRATPEQFAEVIRRDLARWQKVIARAKIRVE